MVKAPTSATLRKYGLDLKAWCAILKRQGGVCAVCKKVPTTGRFNIDHDHTLGWKKLEPDERAEHVRGLLCWWCNKTYVGRAITLEKARNVVAYLEWYASTWGALEKHKTAFPPRTRTTKTTKAPLSLR